MATCKGRTAKGEPCGLDAQDGTDHCRFHGPPAMEALAGSGSSHAAREVTAMVPAEPVVAGGAWECPMCGCKYAADAMLPIIRRRHRMRVHHMPEPGDVPVPDRSALM